MKKLRLSILFYFALLLASHAQKVDLLSVEVYSIPYGYTKDRPRCIEYLDLIRLYDIDDYIFKMRFDSLQLHETSIQFLRTSKPGKLDKLEEVLNNPGDIDTSHHIMYPNLKFILYYTNGRTDTMYINTIRPKLKTGLKEPIVSFNKQFYKAALPFVPKRERKEFQRFMKRFAPWSRTRRLRFRNR